MGIQPINPVAIQKAVKASTVKTSGKDFNTFLGAAGTKSTGDVVYGINAMSGAATQAGSLYGGNSANAVLAAAFSGTSQLSSIANARGQYSSYGMLKASGAGATDYISGGGNSAVIPGTEGYTQWDMINTMNQNNLELLELQALMQSNMQAWNTKSNILSADHRARMAMIEKFTARG